jgi:hypothetical protein
MYHLFALWDLADSCAIGWLSQEHKYTSGGTQKQDTINVGQEHILSIEADIRVNPNLNGSTAAIVGIVAHEVAHVVLGHYQQLSSGIKSAATIEAEADQLAPREIVRFWNDIPRARGG